MVRKEYDDGIYDKRILLPGVEYGGRAFSQTYRPFDLEMERIEPDFTIYEKFSKYYGSTKTSQKQLQTILNATNFRLSLDGATLEPFPYERLRPRHPSVIFHDYDLGAVCGAFELIEDVSKSRGNGLTYRIGNKYPINVYDFQELEKWLSLTPMGSCFYLQYNGVLEDEQLVELVENPNFSLRQLVYNFTYKCANETEFTLQVLPQIYKQALFLRSNATKILLNIDTDFFKTTELLNLMKLIDCFYGKNRLDYVRPHRQTLYEYCAWKRRAFLEVCPWIHFTVSREEMRESFQYIRKNNYEVFDMFYSTPSVILKGGKFVNEWTANKSTD